MVIGKRQRQHIDFLKQGPVGRKRWAERPADENVVVQIPDRCLTRVGILKHIVRVAVAVKVGRSHQGPATGQSRPKSSADENVDPVQIPDGGLARAGVEQEHNLDGRRR